MLRCRLWMSNKRASCAAYGRARAAYRHRKGAAMTVLLEPFASVYDDRSRLGIILARGRGGFEAYAADDHSLGLFPSPRKAAAAIPTTRPRVAQTAAEDKPERSCPRLRCRRRPSDQPQDRQSARLRNSGDAARPRRRGDRMKQTRVLDLQGCTVAGITRQTSAN